MHCNLCFERQARSWHISSCGKIACQNCVQKLKKTHCEECKGPCARTIELNSKAPKEVQRLFGDITNEIKAVSKIMNFQDTQKAKFISALKRNNDNLDKRRAEMKKLKESKLSKIEEAKMRLAAVNEEIKRKKSLIKSYDANAENQPPGFMGENVDRRSESLFDIAAPPPPSDSLLSLFPQPETGEPGFFTSTPVPPQTQTGNHTLDGGFMQLRTPAAWYCPEGRRRREGMKANRSFDRPRAEEVKSPTRTSFDMSRMEVRSPLRTSFDCDMRRPEKMKSPVEKALDKLLGEYILSFFLLFKCCVLLSEEHSPVKMAKNRNYVPCHNRRKRNNANPYPSIFNPIQFFTSKYR